MVTKEKKPELADANILAMSSDQYRAQALKWIELRKIAYRVCKVIGYIVPIVAAIAEIVDVIWD